MELTKIDINHDSDEYEIQFHIEEMIFNLIFNPPGDGYCLYNCLQKYFLGSIMLSPDLWKEIILNQILKQTPSILSVFSLNNESDEEYCSRLGERGSWGDSSILWGFTSLTNINIFVCDYDINCEGELEIVQSLSNEIIWTVYSYHFFLMKDSNQSSKTCHYSKLFDKKKFLSRIMKKDSMFLLRSSKQKNEHYQLIKPTKDSPKYPLSNQIVFAKYW